MSKSRSLFIALLLLTALSCYQKRSTFFSYVEGKTGISGVVTLNGIPVENVEVYLYRNTKKNFRGPADFLDLTDPSGKYFIDVPEGSYYIIARKRTDGVGSGPIKKGDFHSGPIYEPVIVKKGFSSKVDLTLRRLFGSLIQKESGQKKTSTAISGIITGENGDALKGVYAFAYKNDDLKREPDYFSTETEADGRFTLYFEEGGRYYIGGRGAGRGMPKPGELFGLYEGARGNSIFIKTDEKINDIKIILKKYK